MDSKKKLQEEVEVVLRTLHQTIDSLKEKVDKLCESTGCFGHSPVTESSKKDKK